MQREERRDNLLMRLLTSVHLFAGLNRTELLTVLSISKKVEFPADHYLFREGDKGDSLFVIIAGDVEISKATPNGALALIATTGPGDVIGDMALIEQLPRNANACAKSPTVALEIAFRSLKSQSTLELVLLRNMARLLARRLRIANETSLEPSDKGILKLDILSKDPAEGEAAAALPPVE